jgi:hypothetical protein
VTFQFNSRDLSKRLQRASEIHVPAVHDPVKNIARRSARPTLVTLGLRRHIKRGPLVLMERTETLKVLSDFLESNFLAYQINEVDSLTNQLTLIQRRTR